MELACHERSCARCVTRTPFVCAESLPRFEHHAHRVMNLSVLIDCACFNADVYVERGGVRACTGSARKRLSDFVPARAGLSGTVLLSASADLNALLPPLVGDACAAPASQGLIHSNSWTSLIVRDFASTPVSQHHQVPLWCQVDVRHLYCSGSPTHFRVPTIRRGTPHTAGSKCRSRQSCLPHTISVHMHAGTRLDARALQWVCDKT